MKPFNDEEVRAARLHMDGTAEVRRDVQHAQSSKREARRGVQHNASGGHDHGLPQRVLRTPTLAGFLRCAALPVRVGRHDENDSPSAHVGPKGDLHPGLSSQRHRPD
ncbi:hypothetical protein AVEN_10785-1 [Araneus ventricosus]|uniref:Uncharacterized protein n=1 Tax=Araneus ventricosus TaxID=182803 RepID=A0A4Y2DFG4_ARAVE|nr:hypothetical protein AVEN_10785-1 [Araneus ventricosus]